MKTKRFSQTFIPLALMSAVLVAGTGCPSSEPPLPSSPANDSRSSSRLATDEPLVRDRDEDPPDEALGTGPAPTAADPIREATERTGDAPAESARGVPATTSRFPLADWPKPDLALFLTGRQHGYLEPCGCTGLANAKGGLARRFTLMKQLEQQGWNVVALDVGGQVRRYGHQAELKFQTTAEVLRKMPYRAVGFGPDDLRLSFGEVYAAVAELEGTEGPFVCANVRLLDSPPRFRVIETNFGKLGITSVLGTAEQQQVGEVDEIEFQVPKDALREVLAQMKEQSCEFYVLLAHASIDESKELAKTAGEFQLVVTAGGADEPALEPEAIEGTSSLLIQTGAKGMYVGVVGLYREGHPRIRYQRITLDAAFADSPKALEIFANYQSTLKDLGLEGLGLRPVRHPSGRSFVGSAVCGECHTSAYEVFKNTPHFKATLSLYEPAERSNIPRHFDPECLSCHVTGWNPQGFFPYTSGYVDYSESQHLHGNGCENCHGPGSAHVAAEKGEGNVTEQQLAELRHEMRLTLAEAKNTKCHECHDLDNSPDFQKEGAFEKYWDEVKHYGKD